MILVYPLLTSESVNPTLLPGIIKAVEKYIIVNNIDEVLNHFNSALSGVVKAGITGAITVGASVAAAAILAKGTARIKKSGKELKLTEAGYGGGSAKVGGTMANPNQPAAIPPTAKQQIVQGVADSVQKAASNAGIKSFEMPKYDTVSLEPSWVQVNTNSGAKLIGVKVVPYKVKSTTGMVGLLMSDKELKKLSYHAAKMGRTVSRVLSRAIRALPGVKGKIITGDAKTDIVLAKSEFGKNAFVCFSQLDIEKDDIFTSPDAVKRLQKLGWTSMIITDDVNKQATFCMKQFGGICSTIPYSFIFASLGKEHAQVYKDLEDAARSAGPFFRKKSTTRRKLFSQ